MLMQNVLPNMPKKKQLCNVDQNVDINDQSTDKKLENAFLKKPRETGLKLLIKMKMA